MAVTKVSPCRFGHLTVTNDSSSGQKVEFFHSSSKAEWRELLFSFNSCVPIILCTLFWRVRSTSSGVKVADTGDCVFKIEDAAAVYFCYLGIRYFCRVILTCGTILGSSCEELRKEES